MTTLDVVPVYLIVKPFPPSEGARHSQFLINYVSILVHNNPRCVPYPHHYCKPKPTKRHKRQRQIKRKGLYSNKSCRACTTRKYLQPEAVKPSLHPCGLGLSAYRTTPSGPSHLSQLRYGAQVRNACTVRSVSRPLVQHECQSLKI